MSEDEQIQTIGHTDIYKGRNLYRKYKKYEPLAMKPLDPYGLGIRIRNQRHAKGLSREALAARIGISATYLADIEYGTKTTSIKIIYALSRVLELPLHYMLTGSHHPRIQLKEAEVIRVTRNICALLCKCSAHEIKYAEKMLALWAERFNLLPSDFQAGTQTDKVDKIRIRTMPGNHTGYIIADAFLLLFENDTASNTDISFTLNLPDMARRIKRKRLAHKLSRFDVAEYLDITEHYVASIEYGLKCVSLPRFYTLMHLLQTTADDLAGVKVIPVRFRDPGALESILNICSIVLSAKPADAVYLFTLTQSYVKTLKG